MSNDPRRITEPQLTRIARRAWPYAHVSKVEREEGGDLKKTFTLHRPGEPDVVLGDRYNEVTAKLTTMSDEVKSNAWFDAKALELELDRILPVGGTLSVEGSRFVRRDTARRISLSGNGRTWLAFELASTHVERLRLNITNSPFLTNGFKVGDKVYSLDDGWEWSPGTPAETVDETVRWGTVIYVEVNDIRIESEDAVFRLKRNSHSVERRVG